MYETKAEDSVPVSHLYLLNLEESRQVTCPQISLISRAWHCCLHKRFQFQISAALKNGADVHAFALFFPQPEPELPEESQMPFTIEFLGQLPGSISSSFPV